MRSVPMLKCSSERCVCAPQSLSAGTDTSPMESFSTRMSASLIAVLLLSLTFEFVGHVDWFPNSCLELAVPRLFVGNLRLPVQHCLPAHGLPDHAAELTGFRERRKQACLLILLRWQMTDQFLSGGFDHRVRDAFGFGCEDSQSESRKYVRVIGLSDGNLFPTDIHRLEGAAGTNQRSALCPIHKVLRGRFTA